MDKTSKKVTKDPKRQERGKKSHETYMKRLKEKILEDNQLPKPSTSSSTGALMPSTPSHTTTTNDTYVYGVGMLAVLAIGVCVFFAYNTLPKNKKQHSDRSTAQHERKKDQLPPKRRHTL